jgi:hypothetical protein
MESEANAAYYPQPQPYPATALGSARLSEAPSPPLTDRIGSMLVDIAETLDGTLTAQHSAITRLFGQLPVDPSGGGLNSAQKEPSMEDRLFAQLSHVLSLARTSRQQAQQLNGRL